MPMGSTQPLTMVRAHALGDRVGQGALAARDPLGETDAADRPAAAAIEAQRERAQQEFKRIWNLCTPIH